MFDNVICNLPRPRPEKGPGLRARMGPGSHTLNNEKYGPLTVRL
jgi:hypothetical protein